MKERIKKLEEELQRRSSGENENLMELESDLEKVHREKNEKETEVRELDAKLQTKSARVLELEEKVKSLSEEVKNAKKVNETARAERNKLEQDLEALRQTTATTKTEKAKEDEARQKDNLREQLMISEKEKENIIIRNKDLSAKVEGKKI